MSDDRTPQVAVVGCGYWGKNLVRAFADLKALALVCDASVAGRQRATTLVPDLRVADQFSAVLQSTVSGVVIATQGSAHFDQAKAALLADKDVFVEKPLALTLAEGSELVRLAAARKRILMVGHLLEYHPAIRQLTDRVHAGEIGQLRYIYSRRLSLGKVRREENVLWSFAPHDISMILGLTNALPTLVAAHGTAYLQPAIHDVAVINIQFADRLAAHVNVSWVNPFKEHKLVVIGAKGSIAYDDVRRELLLYHRAPQITDDKPPNSPDEIETLSFAPDQPLQRECAAFLAAISSRRPPLTTGESSLHVLKVLETAQRSLVANGSPMRLGP